MDFALQCARHYGTAAAVRTHLDGCALVDPGVQEAVYSTYDVMLKKYERLGVILQGVANLWLPLWLEPVLATTHADLAAQHPNVLLGAYIGNPENRDETVSAMNALFGHTQRLSLDVDMHIDESNDPACCSLMAVIEALQHARDSGYTGRVVLGHCCALSLQEPDRQLWICQQMAHLKAMLVANPFTNLGLQDRRGSTRPISKPIPADANRTPQWRGLTLVQELQAAGVAVSVASDNVRDQWYHYGDYDMLSVWSQGVQLGHLPGRTLRMTPPQNPWACCHLLTKRRRTAPPTIACLQLETPPTSSYSHNPVAFQNCGRARRQIESSFEVGKYKPQSYRTLRSWTISWPLPPPPPEPIL